MLKTMLTAVFINIIIIEVCSSARNISIESKTKSEGIVDVEVFGEASCIHTTKFFQLQLLPAYKKFGSHLRVQYHPFGIPKYTKCAWNGTQIECSCQHGPKECEKNALQACVISYLPETNSHLDILGCIQGPDAFNETVQKCLSGQESRLPVPSGRLARCALSDGGRSLMDYHGWVQHYKAPELFWVPWVVINGVRDSEAEHDLQRVLCTRYFKLPRPATCTAYELTEPL